jgi:hypothetical protein
MLKRCAVLCLALVLPSCGGGGGGNGPNPVPTPAPVSAAVLRVEQTATATLCVSPLSGFNFRIFIPFRITESAGLGANVNFVRFSLLRGGAEVERHEIGANDIIRVAGTNHISANGSISGRLIFDFNQSNFDTDRTEFNFTDDRSNNQSATLTNLQATFANTCPS